MNKNFKIFFSFVLLFELLVFGLMPIMTMATALTPEQMDESEGFYGKDSMKLNVPIGNTVRVAGLGEYVQLWYNFVVGSVGIMAAVIIMWGGFKWLTSHGNSAMIGDAKDRIFAAITGLVIAFLSFTIFQLINPDLLNLTMPTLKTVDVVTENNKVYGNAVGSEDNVPLGGVQVGAPTGDEAAVRQRLADAGIGINAGPERTQVGGENQNTIDQVIYMANDYRNNGGEEPFVQTGGSETVGHSTGAHPAGAAADVRSGSQMDFFVENNVIGGATPVGYADKYPIYEVTYNGRSTQVIDERTRPGAAHWHFTFR